MLRPRLNHITSLLNKFTKFYHLINFLIVLVAGERATLRSKTQSRPHAAYAYGNFAGEGKSEQVIILVLVVVFLCVIAYCFKEYVREIKNKFLKKN